MEETNYLVGFILILIGIVVKHGKMYNLIAGYNTKSTEEKKKFDIEGFSTIFRNYFILMGVLIIGGQIISSQYELGVESNDIGFAVVVIIVSILLIHGRKFSKK